MPDGQIPASPMIGVAAAEHADPVLAHVAALLGTDVATLRAMERGDGGGMRMVITDGAYGPPRELTDGSLARVPDVVVQVRYRGKCFLSRTPGVAWDDAWDVTEWCPRGSGIGRSSQVLYPSEKAARASAEWSRRFLRDRDVLLAAEVVDASTDWRAGLGSQVYRFYPRLARG